VKPALFLFGFPAFAQTGEISPKTFEDERKLNDMRYARMDGWRKEQVVDRAAFNK